VYCLQCCVDSLALPFMLTRQVTTSCLYHEGMFLCSFWCCLCFSPHHRNAHNPSPCVCSHTQPMAATDTEKRHAEAIVSGAGQLDPQPRKRARVSHLQLRRALLCQKLHPLAMPLCQLLEFCTCGYAHSALNLSTPCGSASTEKRNAQAQPKSASCCFQ
jgi:hypothetical protein